MNTKQLLSIPARLWNDEQGFVVSAELVLIASVAVLAMIVGLAAYRDGVVDELADNARAVNALNQSYSVEIGDSTNTDPEAGPVISVTGTEVTVSRDFGDSDPGAGVDPVVMVSSTFENYSYTDATDFCATVTITRIDATANEESDPSPGALLP